VVIKRANDYVAAFKRKEAILGNMGEILWEKK
jgi:hypothetical protein